MQKLHQNSVHKDELGVFLVIAFVASALFSLAMTFYYNLIDTAIKHANKILSFFFIIFSLNFL